MNDYEVYDWGYMGREQRERVDRGDWGMIEEDVRMIIREGGKGHEKSGRW